MLKTIITTSGSKVYGIAAGLAVLIITARWLGAESRGEIVAVTAWVGMFATFGSFSIGSAIFTYASKHRDRDWHREVTSTLLFIVMATTMASYLIVTALYFFTGGSFFKHLSVISLLLGFMQLPFMLWEAYGSSMLICMQKINTYNISQVIARSASLIAITIFFWCGFGVTGVLLALLIAQVFVAIGCFKDLTSFVDIPFKIKPAVIKELVGNGLKVHIHSIAIFFVSSVNILIVNRFCTLADTAHYQLACQILSMMIIIPQSACQVMFGNAAEMGPHGAWNGQRIIIFRIMLFVLALAAIGYFTAPYIIPVFFGESFRPSILIVQIMLASLPGMTLSAMMAVQWISRGLLWQLSISTLLIGALNVSLAFSLVPSMNVYGAVWSTVICQWVAFFVNLALLLYCEKRRDKPMTVLNMEANRVSCSPELRKR